MMTMQKPAPKEADEAYTCKDESHQVCGDPANDLPQSKVFCVPKASVCPLTALAFEGGKLVGKSDAATGPPVINV